MDFWWGRNYSVIDFIHIFDRKNDSVHSIDKIDDHSIRIPHHLIEIVIHLLFTRM